MSLFWWNLFPQNWQGYGLVSEWIKRWVLKVLERLNALPHCLHSNTFSAECTALCCVRLISWPNVLLHSSQANGLFPLWDLLACTYKNHIYIYSPREKHPVERTDSFQNWKISSASLHNKRIKINFHRVIMNMQAKQITKSKLFFNWRHR